MDKSTSVPITTARFLLREYRKADEADFVDYQTDPRFAIHHATGEKGADHARQVFALFLAWQGERPRANHQFAVCRRVDESRVIGSCGIRRSPVAPHEAEFGLELARPWWGRHGYATEIAGAVIDWAFAWPDLLALTARIAPGNTAATRLASHIGFEPMGDGITQVWRLERSRWSAATTPRSSRFRPLTAPGRPAAASPRPPARRP